MTDSEKGWIGVDLDGTLAQYHGWEGIENIGVPIPLMVERVKWWVAQGQEVRIFTARVTEHQKPGQTHMDAVSDAFVARRVIEGWCQEHIGKVLPVTNVKDYGMILLYDDRCVQVEMNTGRVVENPGD